MNEAQQGDAETIERARSGDVAAFGALVRRYERLVLAFLLPLVGDRAAAEDLAQETFFRAFQGLGALREPGQFVSWLCGIARNAQREWARARRVRKADALPSSIADSAASASKADREEFHRLIHHLVQELPSPYQEVLQLRYYRGSSCAEIAALLGRPLGTITKQLSRAHALVSERLQELRGFTTLLAFWTAEPAPE